MNSQKDLAGESPELEQALKHFKASMDAWSDSALSRPRTIARAAVRPGWRPAAGWALGALLAVGSLAGVIVHRRQVALIAAQKAAQKAVEDRTAAARQVAPPAATPVEKPASKTLPARQEASMPDENLLASVNRDVSREVPAAMEPLAQLMDDNGTQ
jgi:hypothetical protein